MAAVFLATATASETTALVVSDGRTTVTIASAAYTSVADQVTAIQNGANYDNLLFTVDEAPGNKFEMTYKSVGALFATSWASRSDRVGGINVNDS